MPNSFYTYQPIAAEECMGDSLFKINNNNYQADNAIGVLETRIASTSANLTTLINLTSAVSQPGSIVQTVNEIVSISSNLASTSISDTGIEASLTRRLNTSKILIQLTGGRIAVGGSYGVYTYFYASQNGDAFTNLNPSNLLEYVRLGGGSFFGPHNARFIFTPATNITTVTIKVYYKSENASFFWHQGNTEPFMISLTEIA